MNKGDKFIADGKIWIYSHESKRNGGGTHFFAQECGAKNIKMKQFAYTDIAA
jgi:hypothetical protein